MIKSHKNATLAFIYVNIWKGIFLFIFITYMTRSVIVYMRMCVAVRDGYGFDLHIGEWVISLILFCSD